MVKVGDEVRWRNPLDADYSYGTIISLYKGKATVKETGYYHGVISEVYLRYIEKRGARGGKIVGSNSKKHNKRSTPKTKL